MKKRFCRCIWLMLLFHPCFSCSSAPPPKVRQIKEYPVVLVHDLANKYPWSESFLAVCLDAWRPGDVYAVYLGPSNRLWEREINGKTVICGGADDDSAGNDFITTQAETLHHRVKQFQSKKAGTQIQHHRPWDGRIGGPLIYLSTPRNRFRSRYHRYAASWIAPGEKHVVGGPLFRPPAYPGGFAPQKRGQIQRTVSGRRRASGGQR